MLKSKLLASFKNAGRRHYYALRCFLLVLSTNWCSLNIIILLIIINASALKKARTTKSKKQQSMYYSPISKRKRSKKNNKYKYHALSN